MKVSFARSATRHRIPRASSLQVIDRAGAYFLMDRRDARQDPRWLFLGDEPSGNPIEVIAVEAEVGEILVIHAMPMRARFQSLYEEAIKWQTKD